MTGVKMKAKYSEEFNEELVFLSKRVGVPMCPCCHSLDYEDTMTLDVPWLLPAEAVCPVCGFEGRIEYALPGSFALIDIDIAETISLLNTKGYATKYSCQGHDDEESSGIAYIYFDNGPRFLRDFPKEWFVDERMQALIHGKNAYVIRERYREEDGKYIPLFKKREVLESIFNWASSLPYKTKTH